MVDNMARLVELALAEDVGAGDLTVEATVPAGTEARARIVQKQAGVIFGKEAVEEVFRRLGGVELAWRCEEGKWRDEPAPVAELSGDARGILTGERTALNFLGHLSGVATLTARYVEAVRGTGARILDTRKTTPGMRLLEKAAVAAGGGTNHRIGLFDAVLIKENHIALAGGVSAAVTAAKLAVAERKAAAGTGSVGAPSGAREGEPPGVCEVAPPSGDGPGFEVEVECETVDQVREAIEAGADRIMLDNMDLATMQEAVALRDRIAGPPRTSGAGIDGLPGGILLEASGGVNLETVRSIAETGVDLISVGALTHSAPTLDLSMLIEIGS